MRSNNIALRSDADLGFDQFEPVSQDALGVNSHAPRNNYRHSKNKTINRIEAIGSFLLMLLFALGVAWVMLSFAHNLYTHGHGKRGNWIDWPVRTGHQVVIDLLK